jgi:hypothetical protein
VVQGVGPEFKSCTEKKKTNKPSDPCSSSPILPHSSVWNCIKQSQKARIPRKDEWVEKAQLSLSHANSFTARRVSIPTEAEEEQVGCMNLSEEVVGQSSRVKPGGKEEEQALGNSWDPQPPLPPLSPPPPSFSLLVLAVPSLGP